MNVKRLAERALCDRLASLGVDLDPKCRAEHLRQVVVETVDDASLGQALADLREGSGAELQPRGGHRPKFHSAFSSCSLAVNAFGPWRLDTTSLVIGGESGFTSLCFEAKRPIFHAQATPPNLDVLLEKLDQVVAIESKLTEHLRGNERASFANRYDTALQELAEESWRDLYLLLKREPSHFSFLNADQLLKHYLGLRRAQKTDARLYTLIYLYWEPANAEAHAVFAQHRAEIERFAEYVREADGVGFRSLSYRELWAEWQSASSVNEHVQCLRERYEVSIQL